MILKTPKVYQGTVYIQFMLMGNKIYGWEVIRG